MVKFGRDASHRVPKHKPPSPVGRERGPTGRAKAQRRRKARQLLGAQAPRLLSLASRRRLPPPPISYLPSSIFLPLSRRTGERGPSRESAPRASTKFGQAMVNRRSTSGGTRSTASTTSIQKNREIANRPNHGKQ